MALILLVRCLFRCLVQQLDRGLARSRTLAAKLIGDRNEGEMPLRAFLLLPWPSDGEPRLLPSPVCWPAALFERRSSGPGECPTVLCAYCYPDHPRRNAGPLILMAWLGCRAWPLYFSARFGFRPAGLAASFECSASAGPAPATRSAEPAVAALECVPELSASSLLISVIACSQWRSCWWKGFPSSIQI